MTTHTEENLIISVRAYELSRNISGVLDAATELVTNCNDAYQKKIKRGETEDGDVFPIFVTVDYAERSLTITDNAIGMEGEEMKRKLGTVGNYTSESGIRGYFSRGAKDIVAIGNVKYTSIQDGKISEVELTATLKLITYRMNEIVTEEQRMLYGIPNNGVRAKLSLLPTVKIPDFERMSRVSQYFNLRDIFSDPNVHVMTKVIRVNAETGTHEVAFNDRLQYTWPELKEPDSPLIDSTVLVPGWPEEAQITFQLWELKEFQDTTEEQQFRQHGVLVCTDNAIHANESFFSDIEHIRMFGKVRGRVIAPYLDKLMYKLEHDVEREENNLVPCINADRSGLNKNHPYVKDLYRVCYKMLKHVLNYEMKRILDTNDLVMDLSSVMEGLADNLEDGQFIQDLNQTGPFSIVPTKTDDSLTISYLKKIHSNVTNNSTSAKYDFSRVIEIEEKTGDVMHMSNRLKIILVKDSMFKVPVRSYFVQGVLIVELNVEDALLSMSLEEDKEEAGKFRILDSVFFTRCTSRLTAHTLARQITAAKLQLLTANELNSLTHQDKLNMTDKHHHIILPRILNLLNSTSILANMVQNETADSF